MGDRLLTAAPASAIVAAFTRVGQTLATLEKIRACQPAPDEILVHVDAGQTKCEDAIRRAFPEIGVFRSDQTVGPGGARNKLVAAAKHEFVASFDDDSYPMDADYFARVVTLLERFPEAAILCAEVFQRGDPVALDSKTAEWVSDFAGGACVYRRTIFLTTAGYVPLPVAYGMEEVDLALRLHARGGRILKSRWLRVFHDTDLERHADPRVTAGGIANLALLTYLRYPPSLWPVGLGQCCSRILWLMRHGRWRGIVSGLLMIPSHLRAYRRHRQAIQPNQLRSYLSLRRAPQPEQL
jgi:GT2 family glycosyltransferase